MVLITKTLTCLVIVAGCMITLAIPTAQAQTMNTLAQTTEPRFSDCGSTEAARLLADEAQLRASCFEYFLAAREKSSRGLSEKLTGGGTGIMNSMGPTPYNPNMPISDTGQ